MVLVTLALVAVLGVAAAILAAAETAVMLLPAGRAHRLVEGQKRGGAHLEALTARPYRVRAASALCAALSFGAAAMFGMEAAVLFPATMRVVWMFAGALAAVGVVFLLTQALPRALAAANPEDVALQAAPVARFLVPAFYPAARFISAPFAWMIRVAGGERPMSPWATAAEYRAVDTDEEVEREEAEVALLEAVSDFAEKVVREVMVPRTDMKALPDTAGPEDAVALINETGFSRLPVYHRSTDDIRGVLYAKDLLVAVAGDRGVGSIADLARKPYFVPETKPVEELLAEMRSRTHIAIVADEYGGTAGLVTLEDLIEEIVGEISDEYDSEVELLVDLGDGSYRVDARLPVGDLDERFDTEIETEADSIGGLFTELTGRIPDVGDSVDVEGLRLTVTELQGTRIRELRVEPAGPSSDQGAQDA